MKTGKTLSMMQQAYKAVMEGKRVGIVRYNHTTQKVEHMTIELAKKELQECTHPKEHLRPTGPQASGNGEWEGDYCPTCDRIINVRDL